MNLLDAMEGIAYVVRPDGRILDYGRRRWDRFASENKGEALLDPGIVLGRNLFDWIAGETVQRTYRQWMDAVLRAEANHPATFKYRCDAPAERRDLRMSISRIETEDAPALLFQSVLLDATARPPLNIYDFDALTRAAQERRGLPIVAMCSVCQRLRWPPGVSPADAAGWVTAEQYYARGGRSEVAVSHTICTACLSSGRMAA